MGRGRAPCCDKDRVKKGPWSQAEDSRLISFIQEHGHANWRALPKQAGLLRCGKSCRLRWVNYLRPDIKRGNFSQEELRTITKLHQLFGNKWSKIASQLAGRTDNEIKNVWHTHLKKRLIVKESKTTTSCSLVMLNGNGHGHDHEGILRSGSSSENEQDSQSAGQVHEGILRSGSSSENEQDSQSAGQVLLLNQTSPPPHEMVEASIISSSHCSHDAERVIDVMGGGKSNTQNVYDEEVIEIPFEPNLDFWDMLDADYSNNVPISDTIFEEENKRDVESWWSLAYLEKELGLEAATMDGNGATVPVPVPPDLS